MQIKTSSHQLGKIGELLARHFLLQKGYQIIQSNFRIRGGELDLIATKQNLLIFFEVKTRSNSSSHYPDHEQISWRQQKFLRQTARHFLFQNQHLKLPINLQFDLLVIHWNQSVQPSIAKIKHLKNIFSQ